MLRPATTPTRAENRPPRAWLCRSHYAEVLRGLSAAGVHLGQDRVRPDRCASVRARSAGARCAGARHGRCVALSSGEGAQPPGNGSSPAPQHFLHVGRKLHAAGEFLSRVPVSGDPRYLALAKRFLQDDTYFNPLSEGRECSARPACLQPRQRAELRVAGVSGSGQREASARGAQRLRICRRYAELRDRRMGSERNLPRAGQRGDGREPDEHALQLRDAVRRVRPLQDHALPASASPGDSRYGDSMEKVLYNTILGASP